MLTTQERFRRLVKQYGKQGCVLIARHLNGVTPVMLMVYAEGNTTILSAEQVAQLDELITALQLGDTPRGGYTQDESGNIVWASIVKN